MGKAGRLLLLASVLVAPSFVAPARAGHDRDHDSDHHRGGDRRHDRERHGCGCGVVTVSAPAPGSPAASAASRERRERNERRERFSARLTPSLDLRLRLRTEGGDAHAVRFQVLTPQGNLYQEIPTVYRPDGRRSAEISVPLPVAGTFIATSSLFGRWRVVPYLDDDAEPCAAGAAFTILE